MFPRSGFALAALVLAAGLTGCGGSDGPDTSEFKSKFLAECRKAPDTLGGGDCACTADIMDKDLDDRAKKVLLIILDSALRADPDKYKAALESAGMTERDIAAFKSSTVMPLLKKVEAECKQAT